MHIAQPDASREKLSDFLLSEARFFFWARSPSLVELITDIHYLFQTSQNIFTYFKGYRKKNVLG